jgi:hypothetical protein
MLSGECYSPTAAAMSLLANQHSITGLLGECKDDAHVTRGFVLTGFAGYHSLLLTHLASMGCCSLLAELDMLEHA